MTCNGCKSDQYILNLKAILDNIRQYEIVERDGQWCITIKGTDQQVACYDSEKQCRIRLAVMAIAGVENLKDSSECVSEKIPHLIDKGHDQEQAVAIAYSMCEAGSSKSTTLKRIPGSPTRVGGYGVVWGDPDNKDLEGNFFTPETNFFLPPRPIKIGETIQVSLPWLYDHSLAGLPEAIVKTGDARDYVLGVVDTIRADEIGLWIEAELQRHDQWAEAVMRLIDEGVLHWSSGSASHLVKSQPEPTGWIQNWPLVEFSATPMPAEPRNTGIVSLKHYVGQPQATEGGLVEGRQDSQARPLPGKHTVDDPIATKEGMNMTINKKAALAMVRAYAENSEDVLKAVKQATEDGAMPDGSPATGSNLVADALRPLAEELAKIAGVDVEEALGVLVQYVAEATMSQTAPEPEPSPTETEMPAEGAVLSAQNLEQIVQQHVAKALGSLVPQAAAGSPIARKGINIISSSANDARPLTLGRMIRLVAQKRFDVLEAQHKAIKAQYKALGINPDTAGGYLVRPEYSNQIIELLRAETVVLPLCLQIPLNSDTLTIPAQTGGATVSWVGEGATINPTEATFGMKRLVAHKMAALVKISNELLEDSDPAIDAIIREDIARAAAEEIDRVILMGSGLGEEPLGVLYGASSVTALNAVPSYSNLSALVRTIETAKVSKNPPWAWVYSTRENHTLRTLEDTAGNLIFAGPGAYQQAAAGAMQPTLLDYPRYDTNIIAEDGNQETKMFFGQWRDVVVGMRKAIEIVASNEAGDAFASDSTYVRAILRMDVVMRHPESVAVLTNVQKPA